MFLFVLEILFGVYLLKMYLPLNSRYQFLKHIFVTINTHKVCSRMLGRTSVESRYASYRDNQNVTIKTSSLNVNVKCVSKLHSAPNKILSHDFQQYKIKLLTAFQYCQYKKCTYKNNIHLNLTKKKTCLHLLVTLHTWF